jgi:hypothetical protein
MQGHGKKITGLDWNPNGFQVGVTTLPNTH